MRMTAMVPYARAGTADLAEAYKRCFAMIPDGEWICALDHDVMFCTKDWHSRFERLLDEADQLGYGWLTCELSRTAAESQRSRHKDRESDDMNVQFAIGAEAATRVLEIEPTPGGTPAVGVMSKRAIVESGLMEADWGDGIYGVVGTPRKMIQKAGFKCGIVRSIHAYHRYNAFKDRGHVVWDDYYAALEQTARESK